MIERTLSLEEKETGGTVEEEDRGALGRLEEMVSRLLVKYQELQKEKDELSVVLNQEREKGRQLETQMEILSHDKEKVKARIDQLLHRLKGIDL